MDVKSAGDWVKLATGSIALVAAFFALDARYMHAEAAEQTILQLRIDNEISAIEAEKERKQLRLSFLTDKTHRTESEQQEIAYLNAVLPMLDERLAKLRSVKP